MAKKKPIKKAMKTALQAQSKKAKKTAVKTRATTKKAIPKKTATKKAIRKRAVLNKTKSPLQAGGLLGKCSTSLSDFITTSMPTWQVAPTGADEAAIQALIATVGVTLPPEYIEYLRVNNGGEGDLAVEPGWFQVWPAEQVIELNRAYEVHDNLPKFFGIGSNGGGELLAFDARSESPWPVVMIPFMPMDEAEARPVAPDFESFVRLMGVPCKS
jgi:hypothetical protein